MNKEMKTWTGEERWQPTAWLLGQGIEDFVPLPTCTGEQFRLVFSRVNLVRVSFTFNTFIL